MTTKPEHYDVIVKPLITEKATLVSDANAYVFQVTKDANKPAIKEAVEALFNVKVKAVNTTITKGKTKRFRGRPGVRSDGQVPPVPAPVGYGLDRHGGRQFDHGLVFQKADQKLLSAAFADFADFAAQALIKQQLFIFSVW